MATIGATTTHTVKVKKPGVSRSKKMSLDTPMKKSKVQNKGRRGSVAPPLQPSSLKTPESIQVLKQKSVQEQQDFVEQHLLQAMGEAHLVQLDSPRTASSTRSRASAAADVAVAAKELGTKFVLKECGVLEQMQQMLLPQGLDGLFARNTSGNATPTMKTSVSAVSLTSLDTATSMTTIGTDSKRGKTTPATAREGCLLLIRAFCEILKHEAEPLLMVGGFLPAALDECGSTHGGVREASEDASSALVGLVHGYALSKLVVPVLVQSLQQSTEWRVKHNALERLAQCANREPLRTCPLLPDLIPVVTSQVWDTKPQVTKAAASTLLSLCETNQNPDVAPAIPSVVNAICKPTLTITAIQELMATTFVAAVDAPTLSILCPVLARGLKEKLALHKRSTCIVISNMARLVDSPQSVAPFGPLLVPELRRVAQNVQFEEIRDSALEALSNLTKALGDSYNSNKDDDKNVARQQHEQVQEEQRQIEEEREKEAQHEKERQQKEEEERRQFKEAMEAQRQLDKLKEKEEEEKKQQELKKKEKQKRSTKGAGGKCQACGLKKCKKSCLFYSG